MEALLKELVMEFHREDVEQHLQLNEKLDSINEKVTGLRVRVAVIGATSGLVATILAHAVKAIAGG